MKQQWNRMGSRILAGAMCFGSMTLMAADAAAPATAPAVAEAKTEAVWLTDFAAAQKLAAEKKLPILIDFTGSDWCGWCMKLDKEVFSQPEFVEYANANLVLLKIDFPHKKPLSSAQKEANTALREAYGVRGYPTIILTNSNGKVLKNADKEPLITGYKEGGAAEYVKHLKELLASAVN